MDISAEKKILIEWMKTVDDPAVIYEIINIKRQHKFDFEKEWKRGITIAEARKRSEEFISSLPWKK